MATAQPAPGAIAGGNGNIGGAERHLIVPLLSPEQKRQLQEIARMKQSTDELVERVFASLNPPINGIHPKTGGEKVKKGQQLEIISHPGTVHLDELVVIHLLKRECEKDYPGIAKARLRLLQPDEDIIPLLKDPAKIILGRGGSQAQELGDECKALVIDEHSLPEKEQKETCAAMIAAKRLLSEQKQLLWEQILEQTCRYDRTNAPLLTVADMLETMQEGSSPISIEEAYSLVSPYLDRLLNKRQAFFDAIALKTKDRDFPFGNANIRVSFVQADDLINKNSLIQVCRWRGSKLILAQGTDKRTAFLVNDQRLEKIVSFIARLVRTKETDLSNRAFEMDWNKLGQRGTIAQAPEWFLDTQNGLYVVNKEGPVTKIPWEILCNIVEHAFDGAFMITWARRFGAKP